MTWGFLVHPCWRCVCLGACSWLDLVLLSRNRLSGTWAPAVLLHIIRGGVLLDSTACTRSRLGRLGWLRSFGGFCGLWGSDVCKRFSLVCMVPRFMSASIYLAGVHGDVIVKKSVLTIFIFSRLWRCRLDIHLGPWHRLRHTKYQLRLPWTY